VSTTIRPLTFVVALLASLLLALPAPAHAANHQLTAGAGAGMVAPFRSGAGVSAEEVLIAGITPGYTGEPLQACTLLGDGKVLFAEPGVACTVKPGTKVLVPMPFAACSDADLPPFFGETAAEQRACALAILREGVRQVTVSVDASPPQNVLSDRFLVITDQFGVVSKPGNPFGAKPGPTTVVAAGYLGVLRGLPPGRHTFIVSGFSFGGSFSGTWTVDVVPGSGG
jgi:hypothetical protein